jgi:hypothetical protein
LTCNSTAIRGDCPKICHRLEKDTQRSDQGAIMNPLLIIAILISSTAPPYAQRQQPNVAKLKADAQKVVSIISGDKAKTQRETSLSR